VRKEEEEEEETAARLCERGLLLTVGFRVAGEGALARPC
jgi:hypothetical protein